MPQAVFLTAINILQQKQFYLNSTKRTNLMKVIDYLIKDFLANPQRPI